MYRHYVKKKVLIYTMRNVYLIDWKAYFPLGENCDASHNNLISVKAALQEGNKHLFESN